MRGRVGGGKAARWKDAHAKELKTRLFKNPVFKRWIIPATVSKLYCAKQENTRLGVKIKKPQETLSRAVSAAPWEVAAAAACASWDTNTASYSTETRASNWSKLGGGKVFFPREEQLVVQCQSPLKTYTQVTSYGVMLGMNTYIHACNNN